MMADKGGPPPVYNPAGPQPGMYPALQQPPPGGIQYQQQPGVTVVQICDPGVPVKWSWCNLVLACISLFCCSCLGLVAVAAAILAYVDHKVKDFKRAENKQKIARGCAIAGIVLGTILSVIIIIAYAAVIAAAVKAAKNNQGSFNFDDHNGK